MSLYMGEYIYKFPDKTQPSQSYCVQPCPARWGYQTSLNKYS